MSIFDLNQICKIVPTEKCKFETFPQLGCVIYLHQRSEERFDKKFNIYLKYFELIEKSKFEENKDN